MRTLMKSNIKNTNNAIESLNINELSKIRGGETPDQEAPTLRDIDFD